MAQLGSAQLGSRLCKGYAYFVPPPPRVLEDRPLEVFPRHSKPLKIVSREVLPRQPMPLKIDPIGSSQGTSVP